MGHLRKSLAREHTTLRKHITTTRRLLRTLCHPDKGPTEHDLREIHRLTRTPHSEATPGLSDPETVISMLQTDLRRSVLRKQQILRAHDRAATLKSRLRFRRLLSENPKLAHRYIFEGGGERKQLDHIRLSTGEILSNPEDIVDKVTEVYTERLKPVVSPRTARSYPWDTDPSSPPLIPDSGGSQSALGDTYNWHIYEDCLARLPNRKAPGPDGIPNEVIKHLPPAFHRATHGLFQLMWRHKCTPSQWKDDNTILLYKKGDPGVVQNHRPIGLKRTIYKLWTSTLTHVLSAYVEDNCLLGDTQAGFRAGRSTTQHLQRPPPVCPGRREAVPQQHPGTVC